MRRGSRRVLVNAFWAVHHGESLPLSGLVQRSCCQSKTWRSAWKSANAWHTKTGNGGPLLSSPRKHSVRNGKLLLPNFSVRIKGLSGTSTNWRGIARLKKPQQLTRTNNSGSKPWMTFLGKQTISHKWVNVLVLNAQMWSFMGFLYRHCDIQHSNPLHLGSKVTIDSIGKIKVSVVSVKVKINQLLKQYQINKTNYHTKKLSSCPFSAI